MRDKLIDETGKLVLWYTILILIGVFIGWLWAFIALSILYIVSTVAYWIIIDKMRALVYAKH